MSALSFVVYIITVIILLMFSQVYISNDRKGIEPTFYCIIIILIGSLIAQHIDGLRQ